MISEFLAVLGMDLARFFATLFPAWDIPEWMVNQRVMLGEMLATYQGLGVWVDWTALGICLVAVTVPYAIGLGTRLIRAIAAHVPQFGGGGA